MDASCEPTATSHRLPSYHARSISISNPETMLRGLIEYDLEFARLARCPCDVRTWHKCEVRDVRYFVAMRGKADVADIAFL